MPIYEFRCTKCAKTFEILCFRSDDEKSLVCPNCGEENLEKLMSSFSSGASDQGFNTAAGRQGCASAKGFS